MAFVKLPGLQGKLYIPEKQNNCKKKHPCKDCYSCDYCSDDRCRLCRCGRDSESDTLLKTAFHKSSRGLATPCPPCCKI